MSQNDNDCLIDTVWLVWDIKNRHFEKSNSWKRLFLFVCDSPFSFACVVFYSHPKLNTICIFVLDKMLNVKGPYYAVSEQPK